MYNCNFNRINSSDNLNLPQPDCCCPGGSRCCPRCCGRGPDPREPWDLRDMWDPPGRLELPEPRGLPACPGETERWGPPDRLDRPGPTG